MDAIITSIRRLVSPAAYKERKQTMSQTTTGTLVVQKKDKLPIACMNDIATFGRFVAQSGMFGAKTDAEGMMIVGICQQEGWSYADFMANFDIIKGRLSKKPAAMLADFKAAGGTYSIVQRDENGAVIVFRQGKETYKAKCLWEDVRKEPLPYDTKEADAVRMLADGQTPPLKAKYATARSRMQMLWARCVSDGLRAFAPECCKGIYTPEEVDDFAPVPAPRTSPVPAAPVAVEPPAPPPDVEVCPVGSMAGTRWDSMDDNTLLLALQASFPQEVKGYINGILESRRANAAQPTTEGE